MSELRVWHKYYAKVHEALELARGQFVGAVNDILRNDPLCAGIIIDSVIKKYKKYGGGLAFEQKQITSLAPLISSHDAVLDVPGASEKDINSLKDICEEEISAYREAVLAELDMKSSEYEVSSRASVSKEGAAVYEEIDTKTTGHSSKKERQAVSADIQSMRDKDMSDEAIVECLMDKYGAFSCGTTIEHFNRYPAKAQLMDYLAALVAQRAVKERIRAVGE